jgi:carboxyl-terminal processing protease
VIQTRQHDEHIDLTAKTVKWGAWRHKLAMVLVLAAVFVVGVWVGDGKISFERPHTSSANRSLPAELDYSSVNDVYKTLKNNYDGKLTESQLLTGLKEGLARSTNDPYTEYFTAAETKDYMNQVDGTFSGIGAQLGKDADGNLEIIAPIAGTPADKAGLKAKDIITHINNESTTNMSIDTAVNHIRGPKDTDVTLQIVRGDSITKTFTITRDDITIPSVTSRKLDDGLGYIQVSQFATDTATLVEKQARALQQQHVKGLIIDLRSDPGGRLEAAIDMADLWLPSDKMILQEKQGSTVLDTHTATDANNMLMGVPTVVLIDDGSASAAEIVAGALHDNKAATLIGTKSYGKGVVQQILPLKDGGSLKVTIASWYRPNGQNINKKGITPDTVVKLSEDDIKNNNDTQLKAAESRLLGH